MRFFTRWETYWLHVQRHKSTYTWLPVLREEPSYKKKSIIIAPSSRNWTNSTCHYQHLWAIFQGEDWVPIHCFADEQVLEAHESHLYRKKNGHHSRNSLHQWLSGKFRNTFWDLDPLRSTNYDHILPAHLRGVGGEPVSDFEVPPPSQRISRIIWHHDHFTNPLLCRRPLKNCYYWEVPPAYACSTGVCWEAKLFRLSFVLKQQPPTATTQTASLVPTDFKYVDLSVAIRIRLICWTVKLKQMSDTSWRRRQR